MNQMAPASKSAIRRKRLNFDKIVSSGASELFGRGVAAAIPVMTISSLKDSGVPDKRKAEEHSSSAFIFNLPVYLVTMSSNFVSGSNVNSTVPSAAKENG